VAEFPLRRDFLHELGEALAASGQAERAAECGPKQKA
jgi:hypothetical protein